ncbi:hypothetical protein [Thiolapillus sp.]|uniref:hypothetical protein n=1 Tax=Thiolapillus sp. TaxID=2017437 RepID=UPI003AF6B3F8
MDRYLDKRRCLPGGDVVLPESGAVSGVGRCHGILLCCGEAGESLWQVVIKEQVSIRGRLRDARSTPQWRRETDTDESEGSL